MLFKSLLFSSLSLLPGVLGAAGTLQLVTDDFGANPTGVGFYIYVPAILQVNPPVVVNPHWCHGTAQDAFAGTQLATDADTYGYIVIYPNSPNLVDNCWDVSSNETLTHNGGGDSLGIVSKVKYTLAKYNGNPNRVFSYGVSSGAMMTNVLLGSYPDVFAAGSAWAGVAFGCFAGDGYDVWSNDCATGLIIKTGAQWAAEVYAAYPGYRGFRPKMQVFHGSIDTVLYPQNLQEEIKEWTAVLGQSSTPLQTLPDYLAPGWTTWIYGSKFEATLAANVTHNIQPIESVILSWFDLTCTGTGCYSRPTGGAGWGTTLTTSVTTSKITNTYKPTSTTSGKPSSTVKPSSTTSKPTKTTTSSAPAPTQTKYGQCGGYNYAGPTVCAAGSTCVVASEWYSQCL